MTKHTPGPWIVRGDNLECTVERLTDDGLRSIITRQWHMALCEKHGGTAIGNARLIAKAPELLAMLERIMESAHLKPSKMGANFSEPFPIEYAEPWAKEARQLIATIKGE